MTNTPSSRSKNAKNDGKKTDEKSKFRKSLSQILLALKSPTAVGLCVTLLFLYVAITFYQIRGQTDYERLRNSAFRNKIFRLVEWFDLKNMDGRLNMRGLEAPSPDVALLTIDDRSIEEVGRWPWSREKIAFVVDEMMKYGAKAIGFDIVFSEPQVDLRWDALARIEQKVPQMPPALRVAIDEEKASGQPDKILADTITKHTDKLVLGAFNEESFDGEPFQDYCLNEAFKRANADQFVKLNATFVVDDVADPFVDLEFNKVFDQIFPTLEKANTEALLKSEFNNKPVAQLSNREKNQLLYQLEHENLRYCRQWLSEEDPFLEPLKETYAELFEKSKILGGLSVEEAVAKLKLESKPLPVVQHPSWTINTPTMQENSTYTGSFNANQDSDGTIRRASLFFRTGNRMGTSYIPSIALQTYLIATGHRADVEINTDPDHPGQKIISKFKIIDPSKDPEEVIADVPVDSQGQLKINYSGGRNMYPYLPAKELFNGKDTVTISVVERDPETGKWMPGPIEKVVKKAEFIKDKAFIFGATAIGVYDLRVTPFEKNYPGPETHVTTLGNLFKKNFLKYHPDELKIMLAVLILMGVGLTLVISHTGAVTGFLFTFGCLGFIALADQVLLKQGYVSTATLPAGLTLLQYVIMFFYKYLTEERKKKHLRSTFAKYVSPAIVDEILKDPENIQLGGKKTRMSVLFSDVRGFTTISEKLDPQTLSDVLTEYLTPMTEIVFQNKGTLDKYMGDALMAFFGAPIHYPDHAKYACRAALGNLEKLKDIQREFEAKGLPRIDVGIGINTGEMSVGNMGSNIVRSYTVMGDAVNLGSRLEGINKEYGTRIIISQFTYEDVKDSFTAREVDWVRVKGKNEPVRIYELICEGKPEPKLDQMLELFSSGFALYHEKKFREALAKFEEAHNINPEDAPTELYIERCQEYLAEPPPEQWDGVHVMKTK